MSLLPEPLRKPAKFVKIIHLIDPRRCAILCPLGDHESRSMGALFTAMTTRFLVFIGQVWHQVEICDWSYSELEGKAPLNI